MPASPTAFPKLTDLKPGDVLIADAGFTCLAEGQECEVKQDDSGLYVICAGSDDGPGSSHHYLDGQLGKAGECVGLRLKSGVA